MRLAARLIFFSLLLHAALVAGAPWSGAALSARRAALDVPGFALQVVATHNNQGLPFLVVDKVQATVWVFTARGALLGNSAALLGEAIGDDTVPGIGERKLANVRPDERTTPAGRFASTLGRNLLGQEVLWVDYDSGVSLHRIIRGQRSERRAERLATPTPDDNRVSYGCINVPAAFFNALVVPTVRKNGTIVYVLPETRPMHQVFDFLSSGSVR